MININNYKNNLNKFNEISQIRKTSGKQFMKKVIFLKSLSKFLDENSYGFNMQDSDSFHN